MLAKPLDDEARAKVVLALDAFTETFPRSSPPKRLPLDIATGDEFRQRARKYLVNGLEKGVPSLFVDVKGVYADSAKMAAVGEIVEEIISSLENETSLHGDGE